MYSIFDSCCTKPTNLQQMLLQVEKFILTETHLSLCDFLQATALVAVQETAALLPLLCSHIAYYADDDSVHKSVIDRLVKSIFSPTFSQIKQKLELGSMSTDCTKNLWCN